MEGGKVSGSLSGLAPSRGASAAKIWGSLPPPAPLLVWRAAAPGGRGTREVKPRFAWPQGTRDIRVVPRPVRRFGEVSDHNGGGTAL